MGWIPSFRGSDEAVQAVLLDKVLDPGAKIASVVLGRARRSGRRGLSCCSCLVWATTVLARSLTMAASSSSAGHGSGVVVVMGGRWVAGGRGRGGYSAGCRVGRRRSRR